MAYYTDNDFIQFYWTPNGGDEVNSLTDLNIYRVSDGNMYNDIAPMQFQDTTVPIPGGDGSYYFDTKYTQRNIQIKFAFDNLDETGLAKLKKTFAAKTTGKLRFSEVPYKTYMCKLAQPIQLNYVAFDKRTEYTIDQLPEVETFSYVAHNLYDHNQIKLSTYNDFIDSGDIERIANVVDTSDAPCIYLTDTVQEDDYITSNDIGKCIIQCDVKTNMFEIKVISSANVGQTYMEFFSGSFGIFLRRGDQVVNAKVTSDRIGKVVITTDFPCTQAQYASIQVAHFHTLEQLDAFPKTYTYFTQERIYKGEGILNMVSYKPWANNTTWTGYLFDDGNIYNTTTPSGSGIQFLYPVPKYYGKILNDYTEYSNLNAWKESSNMPEVNQIGSININEYNFLQGIDRIHLFNAGDTEVPFKIYLLTDLLNANVQYDLQFNVAEVPARQIGHLYLNFSTNDINALKAHQFLCIDSEANLIYGIDYNATTHELISTTTLYNKYIVAGDFFKVPAASDYTRDNVYYSVLFGPNNTALPYLAYIEYGYHYL